MDAWILFAESNEENKEGELHAELEFELFDRLSTIVVAIRIKRSGICVKLAKFVSFAKWRKCLKALLDDESGGDVAGRHFEGEAIFYVDN